MALTKGATMELNGYVLTVSEFKGKPILEIRSKGPAECGQIHADEPPDRPEDQHHLEKSPDHPPPRHRHSDHRQGAVYFCRYAGLSNPPSQCAERGAEPQRQGFAVRCGLRAVCAGSRPPV